MIGLVCGMGGRGVSIEVRYENRETRMVTGMWKSVDTLDDWRREEGRVGREIYGLGPP